MADFTVKQHFEGKDPGVRKIYDKLIAELEEFGLVKQAAKKTSIHLDNKSGFGGVQVRRSYINLNIRTDYPIESPRVKKVEKVSKSRWHNGVTVESMEDIDNELLAWFRDAYELSA